MFKATAGVEAAMTDQIHPRPRHKNPSRPKIETVYLVVVGVEMESCQITHNYHYVTSSTCTILLLLIYHLSLVLLLLLPLIYINSSTNTYSVYLDTHLCHVIY